MKLYNTPRLILSIIVTILFWAYKAQVAYWKCSGYMCVELQETCTIPFEIITRCCGCYTGAHLFTDIAILIGVFLIIYAGLTLYTFWRKN